MIRLLVRLSTLSLGLSFVMCNSATQQSQLAALNDRMSQVINALYSSPLLSKPSSTSTSEESQDPSYTVSSTSNPPQVVYVSSSPSYLEAGEEPADYVQPTPSNPVTRSVWNYPYEYAYTQYPPQIYGPSPYPVSRTFSPYAPQIPNRMYPSALSASGPAFPNFPIPQPFPSQVPYPPAPYPTQVPFSAPLPYPSPINYPSPAAYPNVPLVPSFLPAPFPVGPSLPSPFAPVLPPALPQPPLPYIQPGFPQLGLPQAGLPQTSFPLLSQVGFSQTSFPQPGLPQAGFPQPSFSQFAFPQPTFPQPGLRQTIYSQIPYPSSYANPIYPKLEQ